MFLSGSCWAVDKVNAGKWLVYANALYAAKSYDKAIGAYANSLKLDNTNAGAYQGLGNCYYAQGDKPHALQYYKYALQLNPGNTALANFVSSLSASAAPAASDPMASANSLYSQGQYDQAIAAYNQVLAQDPNNARAYQGLGNCYYAKRDKANAVKNYQQALNLNPNNTSLSQFMASYSPGSSSGASGTQVASAATGPKDWLQPAWRSAILPGWGQFYNNQDSKGLILGGITLGMLGGVIGTYIVGSNAENQYLSLTDPNANYDTPYNTWETMANLNHIFYIGFGLAYAYTIIDAIWNAQPVRLAYEPPALNVAWMDGGPRVNYRLLTF